MLGVCERAYEGTGRGDCISGNCKAILRAMADHHHYHPHHHRHHHHHYCHRRYLCLRGKSSATSNDRSSSTVLIQHRHHHIIKARGIVSLEMAQESEAMTEQKSRSQVHYFLNATCMIAKISQKELDSGTNI